MDDKLGRASAQAQPHAVRCVPQRVVCEDGLELYGQLWMAGDEPTAARGVVIHFHGLAGDHFQNPFLDVLARRLPTAGWDLLSVQTRGSGIVTPLPDRMTGGWRLVGNAYERFAESALDVEAFWRLAESLGYRRAVLQGHSLGCSKIVHAIATLGLDPAGVAMLAPVRIGAFLAREPIHVRLLARARSLCAAGRGNELLRETVAGWGDMSAETYVDLAEPGSAAHVFDRGAAGLLAALRDMRVLAVYGGEDAAATIGPDEELRTIAACCTQARTRLIAGADHAYSGHEPTLAAELIEWLREL